MAQNSNNIENSWSFIAFARSFGSKVNVGTCKAASGEEFPAVSFNNGEKRTFAHFGPSLGEGLSYAELVAQARELQVVKLKVDEETLARRKAKGAQLESYIICTVGENSWEGGDILADLGM